MASFVVYGDTSGQVTVAVPAVAGSNTITFPAETGTLVTTASTTMPNTIVWDTAVKTSGFTAAIDNGYFCNTTSGAFTVTLPATPTRGDFVVIVDYAGTAATNNITVNPNGGRINGGGNATLSTNRQGITFTYIDSTQGWLASSNVYGGTTPFIQTYTVSYLVVAGGGGSARQLGGFAGGGGGGAGGLITGSFTATYGSGTVYTAVVGGGGAGGTSSGVAPNGSNSTFTGATTAIGGGGGGGSTGTGASGGSGGGGSGEVPRTAGTGTAGQGNNGGAGVNAGGGGGGASATGTVAVTITGGAGGAGTASSITGSSVTYAGGGGGGGYSTGAGGAGGAGGGGTGGNGPTNSGQTAGTANTGGGAGGVSGDPVPATNGLAGGSGVVILSLPTANYTGITTGSPTVTTSGSNTILRYTASGTYTA